MGNILILILIHHEFKLVYNLLDYFLGSPRGGIKGIIMAFSLDLFFSISQQLIAYL